MEACRSCRCAKLRESCVFIEDTRFPKQGRGHLVPLPKAFDAYCLGFLPVAWLTGRHFRMMSLCALGGGLC